MRKVSIRSGMRYFTVVVKVLGEGVGAAFSSFFCHVVGVVFRSVIIRSGWSRQVIALGDLNQAFCIGIDKYITDGEEGKCKHHQANGEEFPGHLKW